MNGQNRHVDGDDYTWSGSPLERAVLNTVAAARSLNTVSPAPMRDLRTPDQVERDDVQRLEQRIAVMEVTVAKLVALLEVRL